MHLLSGKRVARAARNALGDKEDAIVAIMSSLSVSSALCAESEGEKVPVHAEAPRLRTDSVTQLTLAPLACPGAHRLA